MTEIPLDYKLGRDIYMIWVNNKIGNTFKQIANVWSWSTFCNNVVIWNSWCENCLVGVIYVNIEYRIYPKYSDTNEDRFSHDVAHMILFASPILTLYELMRTDVNMILWRMPVFTDNYWDNFHYFCIKSYAQSTHWNRLAEAEAILMDSNIIRFYGELMKIKPKQTHTVL